MAIDPKEIEEAMSYEETPESVPEWIRGEFEGEVFLSTDGKNTVHVKAKDRVGRAAALKWAKVVYEGMRKTYGTKQAQAVKEYGNSKQKEKVNQNTCKHINTKFAQSKTEKNPGRWFKRCNDCGVFLGWTII